MKNFNQELSIAARKELANGSVDKAWKMILESNSLVKEISKEAWVKHEQNLNAKSLIEEENFAIINERISLIS